MPPRALGRVRRRHPCGRGVVQCRENHTTVICGRVYRGAQMDAAAALHPIEDQPEGLSCREREMLAFERQWWRYAGAKEQAIRAQFGSSATRYYQDLNNLIDRPEALAADPML